MASKAPNLAETARAGLPFVPRASGEERDNSPSQQNNNSPSSDGSLCKWGVRNKIGTLGMSEAGQRTAPFVLARNWSNIELASEKTPHACVVNSGAESCYRGKALEQTLPDREPREGQHPLPCSSRYILVTLLYTLLYIHV